ncbi:MULTISPECIES: 5-carboxymethyl-2-hydroxymuconate Delta-isomerase [Streptomyces]|uniref:Isomerase n=2 Tax=Streptomyces TaxID=1883 RepID=A0A100Y1Y5_9ACTN|nr:MULTISPECIES: isomerase [Streptomyces]KUH36181.1 isomerase [Streptomyces kanasensis]UUS30722.1 isomerase [Streptomyces changanensis]
MPQITVDYSAALDDAFDRRGYARALHPVVVATVAARTEACKTRTRRTEDLTVGDGTGRDAVVHVEVALLAGRTEEAKARLSQAAAALVRDFLKPVEGLTVHVSAEVRDLDASYRKA